VERKQILPGVSNNGATDEADVEANVDEDIGEL